jgi:threonine dehydrogenase-like Zn-dependent dehydrogenase
MQCTNEDHVDHAPYLFGGYAEVNYTPLSNLLKIPEGLDPRMVCTFACPGPTALHAFSLAKRANIDVSKVNVAVVQGLGPVGCFALLYLKALGVKKLYAVTAVKDPVREELARKLGADEVLVLEESGPQAVTELLQKENGGLGVDLCFEASGAPVAVAQGMNILRNRGVYLVPGQYSNSGGIEIQPQMITFKALHIIGSSQYSMSDVRAYLDFLCAHPELHDTIKQLISCYPVSRVNAAFDDAKAGNNVKTLLVK